jgi:hypothetical protein
MRYLNLWTHTMIDRAPRAPNVSCSGSPPCRNNVRPWREQLLFGGITQRPEAAEFSESAPIWAANEGNSYHKIVLSVECGRR